MKSEIVLYSIGVIRTPHREDAPVPIQPALAKGSEGIIEIFPEYREGLNDLEGFDRIWVLFWMNRAKPYKLKVVPYRDIVPRGLFATRAPSRPNPIGISPVRLLKVDVEAGRLKVAETDILDGTPIIDIKPYSPEFDSHPDAKAGWLDKVKGKRNSADDRFAGNAG